jgi:hypothetical protein
LIASHQFWRVYAIYINFAGFNQLISVDHIQRVHQLFSAIVHVSTIHACMSFFYLQTGRYEAMHQSSPPALPTPPRETTPVNLTVWPRLSLWPQ